jgi:antirestriction protein ArdC
LTALTAHRSAALRDTLAEHPDMVFVATVHALTIQAFLLHKLIHNTSPSRRCNRDFGKRFADHTYTREELVTEIGAAFLWPTLASLSNRD